MPTDPSVQPVSQPPAQPARFTPSQQWVSIPLSAGGPSCWVWFLPATAPQTIAVKIPWAHVGTAPVSLYALLAALGVQPNELQAVQLAGQLYPVGTDFLLNAQLTGPDGDLSLLLTPSPLFVPASSSATTSPPVVSAPSGPIDEAAYERVESDWKSTLYLETQANSLRKQLANTLGRLGALNKDLPSEEQRLARRQDLADWADARRFLRDAAAKASRYIKDYDIGVTSSAGRRNWMEASYKQFIEPRLPFGEIDRMQREFNSYRKLLQTLVNNMTSAQAFAVQDGEQRAKKVLARIRSATRASRIKSRGKK